MTRVGSLLPYHSHVDPETVASALNRMIDEAARGRTVFYRFYSEAERRQEPARDNTGLFFFRGRPGAPFAVISPGGPFAYVGSVHQGFPHAAAISSRGHNANGYSLWGSSAGARMAASIGSHGVARCGGGDVPRPSAVVMAYTAHSDYSSTETPTLVGVGEQDGIAPPAVMRGRVEALRRAGTQVEYREYEGLGHGFGLGTGTSADGWVFGFLSRICEEVGTLGFDCRPQIPPKSRASSQNSP